MMYELPPMTQGTAEQQLQAMRDYLVRLARDLDTATSGEVIVKTANNAVAKAQEKTVDDIKSYAEKLKALIIKTADEIYSYTDRKVEDYNQLYVAKSDFGTYTETVQSEFETTARGVVDSYHYADAIEAAQNTADSAEAYLTVLNGQIRRGVITDPDTGEETLGIAISQSIEFGGAYSDDPSYTWIQSGQTFGFYTSTGWQFWIGGQKIGWFTSDNQGLLHVSNVQVENSLNVGANWEITTSNGFGLRYIGG